MNASGDAVHRDSVSELSLLILLSSSQVLIQKLLFPVAPVEETLGPNGRAEPPVLAGIGVEADAKDTQADGHPPKHHRRAVTRRRDIEHDEVLRKKNPRLCEYGTVVHGEHAEGVLPPFPLDRDVH